VRQGVELLAAKQEQMAQNIATLQAVGEDIRQKMSYTPPPQQAAETPTTEGAIIIGDPPSAPCRTSLASAPMTQIARGYQAMLTPLPGKGSGVITCSKA
jgi:hypothetical protein